MKTIIVCAGFALALGAGPALAQHGPAGQPAGNGTADQRNGPGAASGSNYGGNGVADNGQATSGVSPEGMGPGSARNPPASSGKDSPTTTSAGTKRPADNSAPESQKLH